MPQLEGVKRNTSILNVRHRNYRFKVSFREIRPDGTSVRRYSYFVKRTEAEGFAVAKELEIKNHGARHSHIEDEERAALVLYRQWSAKIGAAPSLSTLLQRAISSFEAGVRPLTVSEAISARLESVERRKLSTAHLADLKWRLDRFCRAFGERQITEIRTSDLDSWLHTMNVSPASWTNFTRAVGGVFNLAVKRGFMTASPLKSLDRPKVVRKAPAIFTAEQLLAVLSASLPEMLPLLVLQAFCGLRREEATRLHWAQIHLDAETPYVECPTEITKTSHRRICPIPPCAIAWLRPLAGGPKTALKVTKNHYDARLRDIVRDSGVKWHNNGLRHSFGSYRLAVTKNAAAVAEEMGNSVAKIRVHYQNICPPEQAELWWKVLPP
ncbi:MAG: tyrosine-type recombinase/integrase [Verrucomicrobiota bacterium]